MANTTSSNIGSRFEQATLELFKEIFPSLGFNIISLEPRRSGAQSGFDILLKARPLDASYVEINFFIECKEAKSVNLLHTHEFEIKPALLNLSSYNPDYWILFSPLRYLDNDFQELLDTWIRQYPFAFVKWARESDDKNKAEMYLDLFKYFPNIYNIFKEDVPQNICDTAPEYSLDDILIHFRDTLNNAYDQFESRAVKKGIVPGARRITPYAVHKATEIDSDKLAKIHTGYCLLNSSDRVVWRIVCNDLEVKEV